MVNKRKFMAIFLIMLMALGLAGCSKSTNIFRWAHKGGSNTDTDSLLSDGQAALSSKDYNDALTYYNQLLASDPNNSLALYGKAQSLVGLGGLSLADLIAAVIKDAQSSSSSSVVANSAFAGMFSRSKLVTSTTDLLPSTLNLPQLYHVANEVVPVLKQIADGNGDGQIPADDPDVNINLAFFMTVRSVCRLLDDNNDGIPGGDGDLVKVNSDYTVVIPNTNTLSLAKQSTLRDQVQLAIDDMFGIAPGTLGAINYLERAINKVGSPEGSSIQDMRTNFDDMKANVKIQIDTNVNPSLDPSIPPVLWHPHASLIL